MKPICKKGNQCFYPFCGCNEIRPAKTIYQNWFSIPFKGFIVYYRKCYNWMGIEGLLHVEIKAKEDIFKRGVFYNSIFVFKDDEADLSNYVLDYLGQNAKNLKKAKIK